MTALLRFFRFALAGVAVTLSLTTQAAPNASAPASALTLFDAYLAQAAVSQPIYRADLRPAGDAGHVPIGRLLGRGPMLGPFTYRPKTYEELSRPERAAMLHDPKFHAFLVAAREEADAGGDDVQTTGDGVPILGRKRLIPLTGPRAALECFSVSPAEMLQHRPFVIVLPGP
jgi:hypothetical protein